jgi:hypothetical protein
VTVASQASAMDALTAILGEQSLLASQSASRPNAVALDPPRGLRTPRST